MNKNQRDRYFLDRTNRLVDELRRQRFNYRTGRGGWVPRVNVYRYPGHYEVVVELAGVEEDDIALSLQDDQTLLIKGIRRWPELKCAQTGLQCSRTTLLEIEDGAFTRRVELPERVVGDRFDVEYLGGLVSINLPLRESNA